MEDTMLTENTTVVNEEVVQEDAKTKKKRLKRDVSHMSWGLIIYLIIYQLIGSVVLMGYVMVRGIIMVVAEGATQAELEAYINALAENEAVSAWLSFIMGAIGIGFLFLYFQKRVTGKQMFASNRKMDAKAFFPILCVFMGIQLLSDPLLWGMEWLFNLFGYTLVASMQDASAGATTLIMMLFMVIGAPVIEEIVYRGFGLTAVKKYGKVFAIVVSSVMFGVMHMNLPQAVFAFFVGLVLGYVAIEYSIGWAIFFHLLNNGTAELFVYLLKERSVATQNICYYSFYGVFTLLGIFFLWKYRKSIAEYIAQNKPEKKSFLYAFTTVGMIIFVVGCIALGFLFVEKM